MKHSNKKIVFFSLVFPPLCSIGYKRPLRFANYLALNGYKVKVFAASPNSWRLCDYYPSDPSTLNYINKKIKIVRTPTIHIIKGVFSLRDAIKKLFGKNSSSSFNHSPTKKNHTTTVNDKKSSYLKSLFEKTTSLFCFPDQYSSWFLTATPMAIIHLLMERPKLIYVTGPPWTPFLVAFFAGKILKVPIWYDYRDPWTMNSYWRHKTFAHRIEKLIIDSSVGIITNTEQMSELFKTNYPKSNIHVIYNGFDSHVEENISNLRKEIKVDNHAFTISHVGLLYIQRMPISIARLFSSIAQSWAERSCKLHFQFVGNVINPSILQNEFNDRNVKDSLVFINEVSPQEALKYQLKSDILLLLQLGTKIQIPAKIFEYALTGRPVLCFSDKDSETSQLINKYNLGIALNENSSLQDFDNWLTIQYNRKNKNNSISTEFLNDFNGEMLSSRFLKTID